MKKTLEMVAFAIQQAKKHGAKQITIVLGEMYEIVSYVVFVEEIRLPRMTPAHREQIKRMWDGCPPIEITTCTQLFQSCGRMNRSQG